MSIPGCRCLRRRGPDRRGPERNRGIDRRRRAWPLAGDHRENESDERSAVEQKCARVCDRRCYDLTEQHVDAAEVRHRS